MKAGIGVNWENFALIRIPKRPVSNAGGGIKGGGWTERLKLKAKS